MYSWAFLPECWAFGRVVAVLPPGVRLWRVRLECEALSGLCCRGWGPSPAPDGPGPAMQCCGRGSLLVLQTNVTHGYVQASMGFVGVALDVALTGPWICSAR